MVDSQSQQDSSVYYIRTEICQGDPVDLGLIALAIESLGGRASERGYYFPSLQQRAAAMEVLGEKFGSRYFTAAD